MILKYQQATSFHHMVEQILFATSRSSKCIKVAIAFIMYPSKEPKQGWLGKIVRVIIYIRGNLHLPLILSFDILSVIKWWADVSFDAHPDCKAHTRAIMPMGSGLIMEISFKEKINKRSST